MLRYEDMKERPLETFGRAVRFAGLDATEEQIEKAGGSWQEELTDIRAERILRDHWPVMTRFGYL